MAFFSKHFGGDVIENIYLAGEPGSFEDPKRLNLLLQLQRELEALPEVGRAISIADWVREINGAFDGEEAIPRSRKPWPNYYCSTNRRVNPERSQNSDRMTRRRRA